MSVVESLMQVHVVKIDGQMICKRRMPIIPDSKIISSKINNIAEHADYNLFPAAYRTVSPSDLSSSNHVCMRLIPVKMGMRSNHYPCQHSPQPISPPKTYQQVVNLAAPRTRTTSLKARNLDIHVVDPIRTPPTNTLPTPCTHHHHSPRIQ